MGVEVVEWDRRRLPDVMGIVDAALPGEGLTEDDVAANLFHDPDPTRVVGAADGSGVAAMVVRTAGERVTAHVQLVAVAPRAQRAGVGTALLADLQRWAFDDLGASAIVAGGGAPFFLWPGVDVHATSAQCLFEKLGYATTGAMLDLAFPSRFRAPVPDGVEVRRVVEDADAARTLAFVGAHWPNWVAECGRSIEHGTCHVALLRSTGEILAFGCHSVNRFGHLGPIGTNPDRQHGGVGSALLGAIATDVMAAGLDVVRVVWIGPVRFYAKAAGASTHRAYLQLSLRRPHPQPQPTSA